MNEDGASADRRFDRAALEEQLAVLRPEITRHCYRMLGSPFDAEDAVQETMLRAWRGIGGFERRAALRSWLYAIATNVCLEQLRQARRRALPMDLADPSPGPGPLGTARAADAWVQPIPDARVLPADLDPALITVERESIRLAFVAALQRLTPRQRAVLLLRDVLGWRAREVADLLGLTEDSVNALLRRGRAAMPSRRPAASETMLDGEQRALLSRYISAFERFDITALVGLLHDDATLSMPPYGLWLRGAPAVAAWLRAGEALCRDGALVPVEVNGGVGVAQYRRDAGGSGLRAFALQVVETSAGRIDGLHVFLLPELFPLFGLAEKIPRPGRTATPA
ncbi:sigma-70 family RNA polymerase sigma factor [Actinoallomurus sp. NPDC052308]|uniref:sigma-70 family RNA polymerase sigma factor n=1 Tax=Actinoallomurus sp. NPDC052308 TaxID=3155530 RepID=UPI00341434B3